MNPKKSFICLLAIAVACSGRNSSMKRDQQQYDVVEEGSASGVTSTINAPGETTPPATTTAITDTNADTTTNFTLAVPSTAAPQEPGTIAATLPQTTTDRLTGGYTPRAPRSVRQNPETSTTATTTTDTVAPTTSSTATSTATTDTSTDPKPPPPTDTIGTHG